MKNGLLFLALLTTVTHAAAIIQMDAKFADVAAGTKLPDSAEKLDAIKGVTVLSAPRITLKENTEGAIEIAQATAVPGGEAVPLGVKVTIKTRLTEKGNIWFSGIVTDRSRSGSAKTDRLETAGFATRELYFSGWTPSGETAILRTSPATAKTTKDGKDVASSRELVIYMTLTKSKDTTPSAKQQGTTKPKTSTGSSKKK